MLEIRCMFPCYYTLTLWHVGPITWKSTWHIENWIALTYFKLFTISESLEPVDSRNCTHYKMCSEANADDSCF